MMTKESLMEKIRAYIVDGTEEWESVRDYMAYDVKGFTKILKEHQLSPVEFHSVLPFLKEVFYYSPRHCDDDEVLNGLYYAVLDCKEFYSEAMKDTPMEPFLEMVFELFKNGSKELNMHIEMLIWAILRKSREMLESC